MQTTDLKDLLETVEILRRQIHPELDSGFVVAVVRAEEQNPEDDAEALKAIQRALRDVLAKEGTL